MRLPDRVEVAGLGSVDTAVRPAGSFIEGESAEWYQWVLDASVNAFSRPNEIPHGHILPKAQIQAGLQRLMKSGLGMLWIGHSTFLLRLGDVTVLTDPVFSEYASPLPPSGPKRYVAPALDVDELPPIDLVVVSHAHYDHLDRASLQALGKRFPQAVVLVPTGVEGYLADTGLARVAGVNPGDTRRIGSLAVRTLPAYHVASRTGLDAGATRSLSFSFTTQTGRSLFFAGDTAYGPVFKRIRSAFGAHEVVLVPIGAYAPRAQVRHVHATPEEAARIADELGAGLAVAMHWGTFPLSPEPVLEPPRRFLAASGPPRKVLRIGGALTVPRRDGGSIASAR